MFLKFLCWKIVFVKHFFDIIIIGGGHAGVEAALIGVKKGLFCFDGNTRPKSNW